MPPASVNVCASNVASLIGRHPFQPRDNAIEQLACKLSGKSQREVVARQVTASVRDADIVRVAIAMGLEDVQARVARIEQTKDREMAHAREDSGRIAAIIDNAHKEVEAIGSSVGVRKRVNETADMLSLKACGGDPQARRVLDELPRDVASQKLRMAAGTLSEDSILRMATSSEGALQHATKPRHVSRMHLGRVDNIDVYLVGQADALTSSGEVIEIKKRARRLFHRVVDYELVQILCYMKLYSATKAYLIEAFEDQIAVHPVASDAGFGFEPIWHALQTAVRDALTMMMVVENSGTTTGQTV